MSEQAIDITAEQKRAALEAVLRSETFARSDQLKRFLKFICEMEIAGRGEEINEYAVAVDALGRSEDFSPGDDSAVRNRAYALRRKLDEIYAHELAHAPVRIELRKGSYCPRFVAAPGGELDALTPPMVYTRREGRGRRMPVVAAGLVVAALLGGAVGWILSSRRQQAAAVPEVLRQAWGPLLAAGGSPLVCIATPSQLFVRAYEEPPPHLRLLEAPGSLYEWHQERHALAPGERLWLLPTHNSPLWGEAAGAMAAVRLMAAAGAGFQILPERVVSYTSLRERNLILFGSPEYSDIAGRLLGKARFTVRHTGAGTDAAIVPNPGYEGRVLAPERNAEGLAVKVYGLMTVLPAEGAPAGGGRVVVISGVTSAGVQAAAEFFADAAAMRGFEQRLRAEGHAGFPPAYQVIVETTSDSTLPLTFRYHSHAVLSGK